MLSDLYEWLSPLRVSSDDWKVCVRYAYVIFITYVRMVRVFYLTYACASSHIAKINFGSLSATKRFWWETTTDICDETACQISLIRCLIPPQSCRLPPSGDGGPETWRQRLSGNRNVPVRTSNTVTETACLKLIFTNLSAIWNCAILCATIVHSAMHTHMNRLTVLWIGFCLTGPISLC